MNRCHGSTVIRFSTVQKCIISNGYQAIRKLHGSFFQFCFCSQCRQFVLICKRIVSNCFQFIRNNHFFQTCTAILIFGIISKTQFRNIFDSASQCNRLHIIVIGKCSLSKFCHAIRKDYFFQSGINLPLTPGVCNIICSKYIIYITSGECLFPNRFQIFQIFQKRRCIQFPAF